MNRNSGKYRKRRKRLIVNIFKAEIKHLKNKFFMQEKICYEENIINRSIGTKCNWPKLYYDKRFTKKVIKSFSEMKQELFMLECFAQIGEVDTKLGLANGILERDPIRNVELIEYLATLPITYFVNADFNRRLIRDFMDEIVPDAIRLDVAHGGYQSGDVVFRIEQIWDVVKNKIEDKLTTQQALVYVEKNKVEECMKLFKKGNMQNNSSKVRMIVDAYMFCCFLDKINKYIDE